MALVFPLSLAVFQDKLKIASASMWLTEPRQVDRTASGTMLTASLGDAVWRGSFQIAPTNNRTTAGEIDALLSILDRAGSSFLVYDPRYPAPASGGSGTGTIATIAASRRSLTITGGPTKTAGDMLSFTYGSSPTRYALHRIVNISGSDVEVTPHIQPAVTTGATVTFTKPVMKAVLQPDPGYGAGRPVIYEGPQFSFVQTLR